MYQSKNTIDYSRPLFLSASGSDTIRFTHHGFIQLRKRFAQAGININHITTRQQALEAVSAWQTHVLNQIHCDPNTPPRLQSLLTELLKPKHPID